MLGNCTQTVSASIDASATELGLMFSNLLLLGCIAGVAASRCWRAKLDRKCYYHTLSLLEEEQGEWHVHGVLQNELQRLLRFYHKQDKEESSASDSSSESDSSESGSSSGSESDEDAEEEADADEEEVEEGEEDNAEDNADEGEEDHVEEAKENKAVDAEEDDEDKKSFVVIPLAKVEHAIRSILDNGGEILARPGNGSDE